MGVIYNKSRIEDVAKQVDTVSGSVNTLSDTVATEKGKVTALQLGFNNLYTTVSGMYIDNGKGLVLNSSSEGSTKQFEITVSDNGTITATEIVIES